MMKTATFVRDVSENFTGRATLFELSEPVAFGESTADYAADYVVVSAIHGSTTLSGPETYIFPSDEHGNVIDWGELKGSYRGGMNINTALRDAGYKVIRAKEDRKGDWVSFSDHEAIVKELVEALEDIVCLAEASMKEARNDGAEYAINGNLEDARRVIAKAKGVK